MDERNHWRVILDIIAIIAFVVIAALLLLTP